MKLLALDCSGSSACCALWLDGALAERAAPPEKGDGAQLLAQVDELLAGAGCELRGLEAIAFGRGPGAFTGLRLAASVAQGLAWSTGLPVIPVSSLEAVAGGALAGLAPVGGPPLARALACQDARMGECYWCGYEVAAAGLLEPAWPEAVSSPERLLEATGAWRAQPGGLLVAGSALAAWPELAAALAREGALCVAALPPPAGAIARLAAARGLAAAVPAEQAVPVYVRDDVARPAAPA